MGRMTTLLPPDPSRYEDWATLVAEHDEPIAQGSGLWEHPEEYDRDVFARWLTTSEQYADRSLPTPEGRVHCTQWIIADDDGAYVGFIQLRHELTDFLREQGGHIGYSVRPSRRREGHAARALGLATAQARDLGLRRVLVTCDEENTASARTIESQGGVLEDVRGGKRRYWIVL